MTMYSRAAKTYSAVDLGTMPKTRVVERLFERFERDVETARRAIAARDIAGKAAALDHATQIVVQLRAALDHKAGPELCANLDVLYRFVVDKLAEANLKLAAPPLDAALKVMKPIGEAFRKAHEVVR